MRQKDFEKLLKAYEPAIQRAFLASISEIISKVVLQDVVAQLVAGNIEGAIAALHIEPAAYEAFRAVRGDAYIAGGQAGVAGMPKPPGQPALLVRFDARSPGAEQWLGTLSSERITGIATEEITSIRAVLVEAMERGQGPSVTALDLVGRINPQTGRREGGLIGLSAPQKEAVQRAREELSDPSQMGDYFTRTLRDRRYDRLVREAMEEGRPLTQKEMENVLGRYSDRLLRLRGETIGRTEAMGALHGGNYQAYFQAVESGSLREEEIERYWDDTGDKKVRDSHRELAQTTSANPIGLRDNYISPATGAVIRYPGDPEAPASEIINCLLPGNSFYPFDTLASAKAIYQGLALRVQTAGGQEVTVTSNHPILTSEGWVPAKFLQNGNELVQYRVEKEDFHSMQSSTNHYNMVTSIEDFQESLSFRGFSGILSGMHFHGDVIDSHVEVKPTERGLRVTFETFLLQALQEFSLQRGLVGQIELPSFSPFLLSLWKFLHSSPSFIGRESQSLSIFGSAAKSFDLLSLASGSWVHSPGSKEFIESRTTDSIFVRQFLRGLTGKIALDPVACISRFHYEGPVYSPQTESGLYLTQGGLVHHNCRCNEIYRINFLARAKREIARLRAEEV